jgi:hypothetical protein
VLLAKYYNEKNEVKEMDRECSSYLKGENYVTFVGTLGKIKLLGRPRHSWKNIIICKTCIK